MDSLHNLRQNETGFLADRYRSTVLQSWYLDVFSIYGLHSPTGHLCACWFKHAAPHVRAGFGCQSAGRRGEILAGKRRSHGPKDMRQWVEV